MPYDEESAQNANMAVLLVLLVVFLLVPRDIIMKKMFAYGENNVNIIAFRTFHDLAFSSFLCLVGF